MGHITERDRVRSAPQPSLLALCDLCSRPYQFAIPEDWRQQGDLLLENVPVVVDSLSCYDIDKTDYYFCSPQCAEVFRGRTSAEWTEDY